MKRQYSVGLQHGPLQLGLQNAKDPLATSPQRMLYWYSLSYTL